MQKKKITICACVSRSFIDIERVAIVAAGLKSAGYEIAIEPDLCRTFQSPSEKATEIAAGVIVACYPRAIHSHLDRLGLQTPLALDIRTDSAAALLEQLDVSPDTPISGSDKEDFLAEIESFPIESGTDAWNPILDKERCIECGKCYDFCLFGVYTIEEKRIRVTNPQNCKNNCPACARMCPEKAIIFPKYEKSPVNGGTAIEEEYDPIEMENLYKEKLRIKLQQRRAKVSLLKEEKK